MGSMWIFLWIIWKTPKNSGEINGVTVDKSVETVDNSLEYPTVLFLCKLFVIIVSAETTQEIESSDFLKFISENKQTKE